MDHEDALSLLKLGGSISDTARELFIRVHVGRNKTTDWSTLFLRRDDASVTVLTTWIEAAGESLKSLSFRFGDEDIKRSSLSGDVDSFETKLPGSTPPRHPRYIRGASRRRIVDCHARATA